MPGANTRGRRRVSIAGEQMIAEQSVGGGRVPFEDFLKILLDFQLAGHEKFLSKFRRLFREVDNDRNGVVNESEFRDMVLKMDPNKNLNSLDKILIIVDPYNNQHITFSEAVGALSAELVTMMTKKQ
jgi:Ca2+-binding EF-hand superfamily protein